MNSLFFNSLASKKVEYNFLLVLNHFWGEGNWNETVKQMNKKSKNL